MPGLRELAERTPPQRERYVDLLRALAILIVVLGHWMVIVVTGGARGVDGFSALEVLSWAARSPGWGRSCPYSSWWVGSPTPPR